MIDPGKEIETLEKMNELSGKTSDSVKSSLVDTNNPLSSVENNLSDFVSAAFKNTEEDFEFNKQLQAELLSRFSKMTEAQLIALYTTSGVNTNDKVSKMLAPTANLLNTKQQAEIAAKTQLASAALQKGAQIGGIGAQVDMKQLNRETPTKVLQGIDSFSKILTAFMDRQNVTDADEDDK